MSALKVLGAASGFAMLVATGAHALSITNRDSSEYTVVIEKGGNSESVLLPAGATVKDPCEDGCTVGLADADAHDATAADRFVVEAGLLKRVDD